MLSHDVDFEEDQAEVVFDADVVTIDELKDVLEGVGYRPAEHEILTD